MTVAAIPPPRPAAIEPTPEQHRREQSILLATVLDGSIVALFTIGLVGGSHTVTAELLRGIPVWLLDIFSLVIVRRIHRGTLADMEFGSGKLEQVAGVAVGLGMLFAAAWVASDALALLAGDKPIGAPLGLAASAACGAINLTCNIVAWDSARRVAGGSAIMQAQHISRTVKLVSSIVVQFTLTLAAISSDSIVIAWADGLGALFVSGYTAISAVGLLRAALPDLIDRSAGRETLDTIAAAIARHGGEGLQAKRIRTRRSGPFTFVELTLAFDAAATVSQIEPRVQALQDEIAAKLGDAEIVVAYAAA